MAKIIGWTGKMLVELFNFFLRTEFVWTVWSQRTEWKKKYEKCENKHEKYEKWKEYIE